MTIPTPTATRNKPNTSGTGQATKSQAVIYSYFECDKDLFSTQEQIKLKNTHYFIDKSIVSKISGSDVPTSFDFIFRQREKKNTTKKSGKSYLSGSANFDDYRNGWEISEHKHWAAGMSKIWSGTPGHMIEKYIFGIAETKLIEEDYYKETNVFSPVDFISIQTEENFINLGDYSFSFIDQLIDFPIVTSDNNQRENYNLNGIIEPIPIRPVISNFSINVPFEPQGFRGQFGNGNISQNASSDLVVSIDYVSNKKNDNFFLDFIGHPSFDIYDLLPDIIDGKPKSEYLKDNKVATFDFPHFDDGKNRLDPFVDEVFSRGEEYNSSYSNDLIEAIKAMKPMGTTYVSRKEKSASTGFMYENTGYAGVDSVAFGGYLY